MPSMANITVKNAANADVAYVAKSPSAGDRVPAQWTLDAASSIPGHRPKLAVETRTNGNKNARILSSSFTYPVVETVGGVAMVVAIVPAQLSITLPTNVDSAKVADAFVQLGNLLASTLIRSVAETGYAPT